MAVFILSKTKSGQYCDQFHSNQGELLLQGLEYFSKEDCLQAIASVRKITKFDRFFDRRTSSQQMFYFDLRTLHGDIVGSGRHYEVMQAREDCIAFLMNYAFDAETEDRT